MCKELRADAKVRNVATKKLDSKILAIVSTDIVTAEAHYHQSCYRLYTRDAEQGDADKEQEEDEYDVAAVTHTENYSSSSGWSSSLTQKS